MICQLEKDVNKAFDNEDYKTAIRLLKKDLKNDPENHWTLTKLSEAYYQSYNYKKAKLISEEALRILAECPLVLWDYAEALDMLNETEKAEKIYKHIIKLSKGDIFIGGCWQTESWKNSIVNDSVYELGCIAQRNGKTKLAKKYFLEYYNNRLKKVRSIYPIKEVRKKLAALE